MRYIVRRPSAFRVSIAACTRACKHLHEPEYVAQRRLPADPETNARLTARLSERECLSYVLSNVASNGGVPDDFARCPEITGNLRY